MGIPNCKLRNAVVPKAAARSPPHEPRASDYAQPAARSDADLVAPLTWAQRLKRVFLIDITLCPHCGGTLRVIADVTDPTLIDRILAHVRKRGPPATRRAPPRPRQPDLLSAS